MSIFDELGSIDFSSLVCTRAQKNIADDYNFDCKHIITRLEFHSLGCADKNIEPLLSIRSSLTIDNSSNVDYANPVKISADFKKNNKQIRTKTFGFHDVTQNIKEALAIINNLFDNAPDEIKRVY